MNWDLKYEKGEYSTEQLKKVVQELNNNEDGQVIINKDQVFWHRNFPLFKKNYLQDYPQCRELSDYKQDLIKKVESDNRSENEYDSGPQIESSAQHQNSDQNFEVDNDREKEVSEPDSDNNEYTSQHKKRKSVSIIQEYQELKINIFKNKKQKINSDFDTTDKLDKSHPLYPGLKHALKF